MLSNFLQMEPAPTDQHSIGAAIMLVPSSEVDDAWVQVGTAEAWGPNGVVGHVLISLSPAFDAEMELEHGGEPAAVASEIRSLAESAMFYVPSVMSAPLASSIRIAVRHGAVEVSFEFDTDAGEIFESR